MARDECCYLCNECPNSFATLDELESHMTADHVAKKSAATNQASESENFIKLELDGEEEEKMDMVSFFFSFSLHIVIYIRGCGGDLRVFEEENNSQTP